MPKPVLSICLPTFNRVSLLEKAIAAVLPGIAEHGPAVELVISDNGSTDGSRDFLNRIAPCANVCIYYNNSNIGAARNFDLAVQRANGEFCWIVGDDDLMCPGGIGKVLSALREHPEIDFAFVNAFLDITQEDTYNCGKRRVDVTTPDLPLQCKDRADRLLHSWNELLDPRISGVYLGSMMMCVFRREAWLKGRQGLQFGEPFCSTLPSIYPHCIIFAKTMVGRPAYYIGEPCIVAQWGAQEWKDYLPVICAFWLHQLLDYYQEQGVEPWRISKCRKTLLRGSGRFALTLLFNPKLPCRNLFSFWHYLIRFSSHIDLWIGLFVYPVYVLIVSKIKARR
jgi:glycosyltransferase involved in cell wall biosynthesis